MHGRPWSNHVFRFILKLTLLGRRTICSGSGPNIASSRLESNEDQDGNERPFEIDETSEYVADKSPLYNTLYRPLIDPSNNGVEAPEFFFFSTWCMRPRLLGREDDKLAPGDATWKGAALRN